MAERRSKAEVLNNKKEVRKLILKGKSRAEINDYLEGLGYSQTNTADLLWEIYKELKDYYNKNKENFQTDFYEKYNYLYQKNVEKQNYKEAKNVLDSLVKLTGAAEADKQDVNIDLNAPIQIKFGFDRPVEADE